MRELYPSDSYGLVLWSHGTGWLPANYENYDLPRSYAMKRAGSSYIPTKYWGEDKPYKNFMEIEDLALSLPGTYDFILFDACFMGAVEVLYELGAKTKYFIVSPAEVIADGFPYDKIVPYMWGGEQEYQRVCEEYFNFYNNHPKGGDFQSATIALVKSDELYPLAELARKAVEGVSEEKAGSVWCYPLLNFDANVFYDLGNFIDVMGKEEDKEAFRSQLGKAVVFKAVTPKFFGTDVPAEKFSGLSVYIPQARWQRINEVYDRLAWPQAVWGE